MQNSVDGEKLTKLKRSCVYSVSVFSAAKRPIQLHNMRVIPPSMKSSVNRTTSTINNALDQLFGRLVELNFELILQKQAD